MKRAVQKRDVQCVREMRISSDAPYRCFTSYHVIEQLVTMVTTREILRNCHVGLQKSSMWL